MSISMNTPSGGKLTMKPEDSLSTNAEVVIPSDGAFGITSGNDGGDNYWVKYPDGTMICYGYINVNISPTAVAGNIFYEARVFTSFSENFVSPPVVSLSNKAGDYAPMWCNAINSTVDGFTEVVFSADSDSLSRSRTYQAIGRWK